MTSFNQQNLNVKRTIESTFERAKRWVFSSYPSLVIPEKNIKIDVRYPGEVIPSSQNEDWGVPLSEKDFDMTQKPTCVIIKRGETEFYLRRNTFFDAKKNQKNSYIFAIHAQSGHNYRIIETPDGTIKDQGNSLLLLAAQKDPDFKHYISFIFKNETENICVNTQKWDLNKMMKESRER